MASLKKRGKTYYIQYYLSGKQTRKNLHTGSLQIAKEQLRQFESAEVRGVDSPLPTRTALGVVLERYVEHVRTIKTAKSAQTDIYYLRSVFGAICQGLEITSRVVSKKTLKKPVKRGISKKDVAPIEVGYFEQISTVDVSQFIAAQVRARGLAPKTANRYREIVCRLFNWAMEEGGVRMPGGVNPVVKVGRYKEKAPEIRFLTLGQIDEQLKVLDERPQLQTMVAVLIYAGLRREEALWLRRDDIDLRAGNYGMIRIRAKTVGGQFWEPKTKRNRAVPVSQILRAYLDDYTHRPSFGDWFFPSPQGHRYDPDNFSCELRKVNGAARLRWTCLDYRHTFGSQLAMKGESLYKISTLMGNSPEICRRHYAALLPDSLVNSVEFGWPIHNPCHKMV